MGGRQGFPWPGSEDEGLGGDIELAAARAADVNLRRLGGASLARWDATHLPLDTASVDRVISNPPFGKQLSSPEAIEPLYRAMVREYDRVLRPDGRAVLLTSPGPVLREAARDVGWIAVRQVRLQVLGQLAMISVWQKTR